MWLGGLPAGGLQCPACPAGWVGSGPPCARPLWPWWGGWAGSCPAFGKCTWLVVLCSLWGPPPLEVVAACVGGGPSSAPGLWGSPAPSSSTARSRAVLCLSCPCTPWAGSLGSSDARPGAAARPCPASLLAVLCSVLIPVWPLPLPTSWLLFCFWRVRAGAHTQPAPAASACGLTHSSPAAETEASSWPCAPPRPGAPAVPMPTWPCSLLCALEPEPRWPLHCRTGRLWHCRMARLSPGAHLKCGDGSSR